MKISSIALASILVGVLVFLEAVALADVEHTSIENYSKYLSPCQSAANCVVSLNNAQNKNTPKAKQSFIAPIVYQQDQNTAYTTLLKILSVVPRTKIIEQTENYIHAQSQNRFGSLDELEFVFLPAQKLIYLRSASNNLPFDFGLNRRRLEQIRLAMRDLNA